MRGMGLAAGLGIALSACGSVSVTMPTDEPEAAAERRPAPAAAPGPSQPVSQERDILATALHKAQESKRTYRISAADLLQISVYQEPDLERTVRVSPQGIITLPLVGKIQLGGLDVPAAEEGLTERLKKYLVNPHVSIFIKEYGNKLVYVMGEVQRPGSIPMPTEAPLSVLEAISLAGGFTAFAAQDRTRVIRQDGARSQSFIVELSAVAKGDKSKDLFLEPNDVIVVPETFF